MKHPDPWLKLVASARRVPAEESTALPVGFATRVAAQGLAQRREPADYFGVFALRALGLALAVVVTSAVVGFPLTTVSATDNNSNDEIDDPVAELVAQL
jgi:hypothetical protein